MCLRESVRYPRNYRLIVPINYYHTIMSGLIEMNSLSVSVLKVVFQNAIEILLGMIISCFFKLTGFP